jgi:hypothetical protein
VFWPESAPLPCAVTAPSHHTAYSVAARHEAQSGSLFIGGQNRKPSLPHGSPSPRTRIDPEWK